MDELFSCKGKTAVVTGGCGLIGREIVLGLARYGAKVYVGDLNASKAGGPAPARKVRYRSLDITEETSVRSFVQQVLSDTGKVDILVNCAYPRSETWGRRFEQVTQADWNRNTDDHLGGYFLICREISLAMKERRGGSIINLASIYGVVAPDFSLYEGTEMTMPVAYASIKAGIIALTRYIATYYGPYQVRANTVSPGGIHDGQIPSFVERYSRKTPLGRMGKASEVVGAVVFLASEASSYVTGQNLSVDGGWTAW